MIRFIKELLRYDRCFACGKKKLFVEKRDVQIANNLFAHSREKFCNQCHKDLEENVVTQIKNYDQ